MRRSFTRWMSRLFPSTLPISSSIAFRPRIEGLEDRVTPATITVTSIGDKLVVDGTVTLREAITSINNGADVNADVVATGTYGTNDTIIFNIGTGGTKTIKLTSALPVLTKTVSIDGTSQPGFAPDNIPLIVLNGASAGGGTNGLVAGSGSDGSVIRGLVIQKFSGNGITLLSNGNTVAGDFIGTNQIGSAAVGNAGSGVAILGTSSNNTIGGTGSLDGNVISGNSQYGVLLRGSGVSGNTVEGSAIGTNLAQTAVVANKLDGVAILQGANNNTVGDSAAVNLIAGNRFGVNITGPGTDNNAVTGNSIQSNLSSGVQIAGGASDNTVGGVINLANTISLNGANGVIITGAGTSDNTVLGNFIGTDSGGTVAFANKLDGVAITAGATGNTIGGSTASDMNVISGNTRFGVNITGSGTSTNTVIGNTIGLNLNGVGAVANKSSGVQIGAGAIGNTIGGTTAGERNVISGNAVNGVLITGAGAAGNVVDGNFIGTNAAGTAAIANKGNGVALAGKASNNTIGGTAAGAGNLISGNTKNGVNISGAGTAGNSLFGNIIGLDAVEGAVVANAQNGVQIASGANGNNVGGVGAGNVISGNLKSGILLNGVSQTVIQGNTIGTSSSLTGVFGNSQNGVFVTNKGANNIIGGTATGAGNIIVNNTGIGVLIGNDSGFPTNAGVGNAIWGNSIANNQLGIKLGKRSSTPTPNDNKDADTGPNNKQNSPTITSAVTTVTDITVSVTLGVTGQTFKPNTTFQVEVFANPVGGIQGAVPLGIIIVTTDATGVGFGTATFTTVVAPGQSITATATNLSTNDTSEFSASFAAT